MLRRRIALAGITVFCMAAGLTGCGKDKEPAPVPEVDAVEEEPEPEVEEEPAEEIPEITTAYPVIESG